MSQAILQQPSKEIARTDNLTGFTEAIRSTFPQTITQLCIVYPSGEPQIRNSCKYVFGRS